MNEKKESIVQKDQEDTVNGRSENNDACQNKKKNIETN